MIEGKVKPEEYFHLRDGRALSDLKELLYALKSMDDELFNHHITQDRNDFGNWILHAFKEPELAESVFSSNDKGQIVQSLEKRVFPNLEQLEIEDKTILAGPRKFDFRQQMTEKFETVKEAYQKQNPENENEYSISKSKEPDLQQIVQEIKKKRGRKPKSFLQAQENISAAEKQQASGDKIQNSSPDIVSLQKAAELVRSYPFERTTAKEMKEQSDQAQKNQTEILNKENEVIGKVDEMLLKGRELELRELKILEIEERLEKDFLEIAQKKNPKFFSKEFVHGILIGFLAALIVGLIYVKFWT